MFPNACISVLSVFIVSPQSFAVVCNVRSICACAGGFGDCRSKSSANASREVWVKGRSCACMSRRRGSKYMEKSVGERGQP